VDASPTTEMSSVEAKTARSPSLKRWWSSTSRTLTICGTWDIAGIACVKRLARATGGVFRVVDPV
jgi:hypothetical protein